MALYIDFNYVDIRDYVDLSEVDVNYENYLKSLMELSAELDRIAEQPEKHDEKIASDIFAVLSMTESDKLPELKIESEPVKSPVTVETVAPKPVAAPPDRQQMYIDYINGKYDKSLADFFINILQNPFQTFVSNRFEVGDTIKQDLSKKISKTDENSVEQEEKKRDQATEYFRKRAADRLAQQSKTDELNKLLETKIRIRQERV